MCNLHTRDPILHAAARIDFELHVRSLLRTGRRNEAEALWDSVVEVQHQPAPQNVLLHGNPLRPMATMPCTTRGCERCTNRAGGFRFPWIGIWCKTGVLVQPRQHGPIGRSRLVTSTCCNLGCMEVAFLDRNYFRKSGSKLSQERH